ncbi:hypothetical protein BG003_009691 [Podila horticola]|nr:hypothetical protein BG003_009691 [Podila horticola]
MVLASRSTVAFLAILALSSTLEYTQAHSSPWPTITRSEHILNIRHDILPRTAAFAQHRDQPLAKRKISDALAANPDIIARGDTIRLQFSAYNTTFHLYLEPNHDFIHPTANLGDDISLEDIKAFKGVVVDENYSDRKWNRALTTSRDSKQTIEHMLHEEGVHGWARMMIEHDSEDRDSIVLRGAFTMGDDTYHVTSRQHYHIQKRSDDAVPSALSNLVIYRDSDLYKPKNLRRKRGLTEEPACGADMIRPSNRTGVVTNEYYYPPDLTTTVPVLGGFDMSSTPWIGTLKSPLVKRVAGPNPVPPGCPANRVVNYMGVAADCAYVRSYGGTAGARTQILADFNTASGIYESTFNVALGVITLNIESENCPTAVDPDKVWNQDCSTTYGIDQRLSDFSRWRGAAGRANDGAGLWHLMTKCNSGAVVGIAWTKQLCVQKTASQTPSGQSTQYTSGTGVSSITPNEWMVVAHEIGHGFGAAHDCTASTCPPTGGECCPLSTTTCDAGARYIMNPSEQTATKVFSPCSIRTICNTVLGATCLQPPGTRDTSTSQNNICGNGIRETGEDCDCGSPEDCAADPCCDGTTCKFKAGAVCDDLNDSCCQNCQIRSAGTVCRQAISECDVQEVCSGTSATCPPDIRVPNNTPCTGSNNATGLTCANGICTSRDLQCQLQGRPGITKGCGASNSCDLLCNDPGGSALTCMQIPDTYFVDGTSCGFGGNCQGGQCKYSNGIDGVLGWARQHLAIVIPVGIVVGLLLLCCIWSCICSPLFARRRQRKLAVPKPGRRHPSGSVRNSTSAGRRSQGHVGPDGPANQTYQGAQHAGQPPMQQGYSGQPYPSNSMPLPPAPVYHDPATLREDHELQRALAESRREHEARSMNGSSDSRRGVLPPTPTTAAAAAILAMPALAPNPPPVPSPPPMEASPFNTTSSRTGSGQGNAVPVIPNPFEDQPSGQYPYMPTPQVYSPPPVPPPHQQPPYPGGNI